MDRGRQPVGRDIEGNSFIRPKPVSGALGVIAARFLVQIGASANKPEREALPKRILKESFDGVLERKSASVFMPMAGSFLSTLAGAVMNSGSGAVSHAR